MLCAFQFWRQLACSHTIRAASKFFFLRINVSWMCRLNYWLSCCLDCCVGSSSIHFDTYTCLHTIRAAGKFILRITVLEMSREWLIVVCCLDCFCWLIVVCCAQFICDNYSRVRLQFVQPVSSFSRKNWNVSRELLIMFGLFRCHRRVMCANNCGNHRDTHAASKNALCGFFLLEVFTSFLNFSCLVSYVAMHWWQQFACGWHSGSVCLNSF